MGISLTSGTKFGHKKLETLGYHMAKTQSLCLSHLGLVWYWVVSDWQNRQTELRWLVPT